MEKKEIVIIGVNRYSLTLVEILLKKPMFSIIVIDKDDKKLEKVQGVKTLINGDITSESFWDDIGIDSADYYIVNIDDNFEESLIVVSILDKKYGSKKIMVKSISIEHENVLSKMGITNMIAPEIAAAKRTYHKLINPFNVNVEGENEIHELAEGILTTKIKIPKFLINSNLKDVDSKILNGIVVPMIFRENKVIVVNGSTEFEENDFMSIIGEEENILKFVKKIKEEESE